MKVHVVVKDGAPPNRVIALMSDVDMSRANEFGIVSGNTDHMWAIASLPEVESIETDGTKVTLLYD